MTDGEPEPPATAPTADNDGYGINNATEVALDRAVDSGARYQARIALITAIVALISALLGPLVSLKINSDQITSQGKQASKQIDANTRQSEREFVRTQQGTAYTDFLTAFNNGTLDLLGAAGALGSGDTAQHLASSEQTAVQAVKDVTAAYYKVQIVSGKDSNQSAETLYGEFASWSGELLQVGAKVLAGQPLTGAEQQLLDSDATRAEYQKLIGLSTEFIKDGRGDFDVEEALSGK
jgi:hypothetical protein